MTTGTMTTEGPAPGTAGRKRRTGSITARRDRVAAFAVTLVGLAPVIAVVIQRAGRAYLPMQDPAIIDLRVRDTLTFSSNTPLVGVYSHYWWNHPGPVMFYLVAPFVWLFGNAPWATLVGFALLQGVAIAWTGRLAWKMGGLRWTVVWVSIATLAYVGTTPAILQVPWNPNVALPFFVLFLLQCWVVAQGDARRLLGLAFVASFLVQTHIGYALLVLVLGGWAVVRLLFATRAGRCRVSRTQLLWPTLVLAVVWFPPLVLDPILNTPNNLDRLAHFYVTSPSRPPVLGASKALGYLATEFRWLPPWLGGTETANIFTLGTTPSATGWLAVPIALVGLGWWVSWRRKRRELRLLAELTALLLAACVVSLALIQGAPEPYLTYWRIVAGSATVVLMITVIIDSLAGVRWPALRSCWIGLLAVGLAVGSASFTEQVVKANGPVWPLETTAQSILAQLQRNGQPDGPALIRPWGSTIGGMAVGLIDELAREGKPVFVDRWLGFEFGNGRTATPRQVRWVLTVSENSAVYTVGSTYPGARVVAVSHPLPAAQQRQLVQLQRQLTGLLIAHRDSRFILELGDPLVAIELANVHEIAPQKLQHLARLNVAVAARGCLCSVIRFPARLSPIGPQAPPV